MDENIVQGPGVSVETSLNMELDLAKYFIKVSKCNLNKVLMIDAENGHQVNFQEVLDLSYALADYFHALGVGKNEVVAILSENRVEYLSSFLAALHIGSIFTCVSPAFTNDELLHVFSISKPSTVISTDRTFKKVKNLSHSCDYIKHIINLDDMDHSKRSNDIENGNIIQTSADADETALILYSSGTTGLSKGVEISHKSFILVLEAYRCEKIITFPDNNTVSGLLPMCHTYGLFCLLSCFVLGHKYVLMRNYTESDFLRYIENYRISTLYIVPTIAVSLSKSTLVDDFDLSSIRLISNGGGPITRNVEETLKKRFNCHVTQVYGMTETTSVHMISLPTSKPGTTGRILPGMMAKVIDLQTGASLGPNELGEYCIKGPLLMKRYRIKGSSQIKPFDAQGWLHSGDVAYYDEDRDFYIVDRIKEIIKYKGYQVPPSEIEVLLLQLPSIESVGVIGVPDELCGELPRAYVVKKNGYEITEEEIQKYVEENLSFYKKLRGGVVFVDELPKTVSGKIERKQLKKWVLDSINH